MSTSSSVRQFAAGFALILLLILGPVAVLNYYADPLWIWGSKNRLNTRSIPVDIRVQKVNLLLQHRPAPYTSVLFGSSRTANYDLQPTVGALNFSVHSMLAPEFIDALRTTESLNKQPFSRVYAGLEFGASSGQYILLYPKFSEDAARADGLGYRLKATVDLSSLLDAFNTVRNSLSQSDSECTPCYDHGYHFHLPDMRGDAWTAGADEQMRRMEERIARYWLAPNYWAQMRLFAEATRGRSLIFMTPEHVRLHYLIHRTGLDAAYISYVRTAVKVFGRVLVFNPMAPIWQSPATFYDLHHPRPDVSRMLVQCVQSEGQACAPELEAKILTRANVERFLGNWEVAMRSLSARCPPNVPCDPFASRLKE